MEAVEADRGQVEAAQDNSTDKNGGLRGLETISYYNRSNQPRPPSTSSTFHS